MPSSLCRTFASTLGGTAEVVNGVCTVTRIRSNLKPLIQGRKTNSALHQPPFFRLKALTVEVMRLIWARRSYCRRKLTPLSPNFAIGESKSLQCTITGYSITQLSMYIHFKSVEPPLTFANKVAAAFKVLTSRTVGPNTTSGSRGSNGSNGSRGSNNSQGSQGLQGSSQRQYGYICSRRRKNQTLNQRNPVPVRPLKDLNVRNK